VGPCTGNIGTFTYTPFGAPQFLDNIIIDAVIPDNTTAEEVQMSMTFAVKH
jgi:hypothetical protein